LTGCRSGFLPPSSVQIQTDSVAGKTVTPHATARLLLLAKNICAPISKHRCKIIAQGTPHLRVSCSSPLIKY
uniref:Uncharacterized protein n=1 Tax=Oryza brachyantha TaxID=4533 RepID=J3LF62_ORYBR